MPIRTEPTEPIPRLSKYTPYQLPNGVVPVDFVQDMISYNFVVPSTAPIIRYNVGSMGTNYINLLIKNITRETQLIISLEYNKEIFLIKELGTGNSTNPVTTSLNPGIISTFEIKYNKTNLDSYSDYITLNTNIKITVRNVFDGRLATKNSSVVVITTEQFDQITTVV